MLLDADGLIQGPQSSFARLQSIRCDAMESVYPVLEKRLENASTSSAGTAVEEIQLTVSATNARTARRRIFTNRDISVDALLASACLPQLFRAVEIDGEPLALDERVADGIGRALHRRWRDKLHPSRPGGRLRDKAQSKYRNKDGTHRDGDAAR